MLYKITSAIFLVLILTGTYAYFAKPEVFDTRSVFYDQFYSGTELETRLENREIAQFPTTLGGLALHGPTERGVGVSVDKGCSFSDPNICSKLYRLEYRDSKGDIYFVNISKFKEGKSSRDIRTYISSFSPTEDGNFFRFEKSEIGWISEARSSFVVIQKGVCEITNNREETCSYPSKITADDEAVLSYMAQFPIAN